MRWPVFVTWALVCLAARAAEYPRMARSVWWEPYRDDAFTLGLYSFDGAGRTEEGDGLGDQPPGPAVEPDGPRGGSGGGLNRARLVGGTAAGRLEGEARQTPRGRFGGGLECGAGRLVHPPSGAAALGRTVEFWLHVDRGGNGPMTLVSMLAAQEAHARAQRLGRTLAAPRLVLSPDRRLSVFQGERLAGSTQAGLPPDWAHVAWGWSNLGNGAAEVTVHLNGAQVLRRKLALGLEASAAFDGFVLGGHPEEAGGWGVTVDEVRLSNIHRSYYAFELGWTSPDRFREEPAGRPYFRNQADLTFLADFNHRVQPRVAADHTTFNDYKVHEADDLFSPGRTNLLFPEGVAGTALMVGDGSLSPVFVGEGNVSTAAGTIAFWLRPLDWDNFTRDNPFDRYEPVTFGLFQIDGVYPEGSWFAQFPPGRGPLLEFNIHMNPSEAASPDIPLSPGRWTHIAMCWEGLDRHWYVNGEPADPRGFWSVWIAAHPHNTPANAPVPDWWLKARPTALRFGRRQYWPAASPAPRSAVDDFRVYRRVLSGAEVRNLVRLYDPRTRPEPLPDAEMLLDWNGVLGRVSATLTPLMSDYEQAVSARLSLTSGGAAQAMARAESPLDERGRARVVLTTAPLEFGVYHADGELRDARGRTLGVVRQSFERRPPPWWRTRVGLSDQPMPEWTPVRADGRLLRVWGRDILLGDTGLPERIVSAGGEVLSGPVRLTVGRQGRVLSLTASGGGPVLTRRSGVRADWRAECRADGLTLTLDGYLEFDGMMWFDLALARAEPGTPAGLDHLAIEIPYAERSAELVHWFSGGPERFRDPRVVHIGELPRQEGVLFRSNDADHVSLARGLAGSFIPYVMLTGMERGMAWFAENDRGWTQSTETPAVTIERRAGTVLLRLNVVSSRVDLDGPRAFGFGLHPIPVKPLDPLWRSHGGVLPDAFAGNNLKGPHGPAAFYAYPDGGDWDAVRRRIETGEGCLVPEPRLKTLAEVRLAEARRRWGGNPPPVAVSVPGLYWDMQLMNFTSVPQSREWREAFVGPDCLWHTPELIDCVSWVWDQWITRTDGFIQGAYIDDCWNTAQWQEGGPAAWRRPDGQVQPGFQWRGYRQRFMRMRQISWDHGIHPKMTAHSTHTFFIPYHSFFSVVLDGEDRYSHPSRGQEDFIDHWPLDRMRFMHSAKWGIPTTWLSFASGAAPLDKYPAWTFRQRRAWRANLALHDLQTVSLFDDATLARFGMREPDVEFVPYWADAGLAAHEHGSLRVSAWKRPGRCLVLLVNVGQERLEAAVRLNPAAMGFGGAAAESLQIEDVDSDLLRYFAEDATIRAEPRVLDQPETLREPIVEDGRMIEEVRDRPESLPAGERMAKDPDGAFQWKNALLSCPVRRHDYRLFLVTPRPTAVP